MLHDAATISFSVLHQELGATVCAAECDFLPTKGNRQAFREVITRSLCIAHEFLAGMATLALEAHRQTATTMTALAVESLCSVPGWVSFSSSKVSTMPLWL